MCTVTFVPLSNGVVLSSNRDESIHRGSTLAPAYYQHHHRELIYPRDEKGQGTWIAATKDGTVAVLLNGAWNKHNRKPFYRHSRGLIIPAVLGTDKPFHAIEGYELSDIEPFTLVLFHGKKLNVYRWDEVELNQEELPADKAHCWNSMTLYKPEMEERNREEIRELCSRGAGIREIWSFHDRKRYERQLPEDSMANQIQTISISQVELTGGNIQFHYEG